MSKSTPSLNEATKRQIKQSTAGINSPYTEKTICISKVEIYFINCLCEDLQQKNTITSEKKSYAFSDTLMLKEIKYLETRLENQISKSNVLENELEELKQHNLFLKAELKLQLDSIKMTLNSSNNNKDIKVLNSKNNSGSINLNIPSAILLMVL